ncbi:hypothetical protein Tco_1285687 [Tanacetum coccineum]
MSSITAQQTKLDLELVPKENRIDIKKCNGRIPRGLTPREPTFQVVLDAIALTPCYPAFLITTDVSEVYMHQFWNSVYKHDTFYRFKIKKKKRFKLTLEAFRDIFQICPRVQGREFDPLPSEEDTVSFLRELGHTGEINSLNDVVVDQMHQPWRTFVSLINRSLSRKTSGLDKLRLSEHKSFRIDNKDFKKQEKIYYPRFTKVIIHHFLIQENTLSWRNKIKMHTSKDDYLINTLRFVSRKEASQIYGAVLPECLTSPEMKESKAYKTYLGHATGIVFRETPVKTKSSRKEMVDVSYGKGIDLVSEVALAEKAQLKEVRKKSLRDFHKTHPSGSGMVAEKPPGVEKITPTVTSERTGDKPGVPDVIEDDSTESECESWEQDEEYDYDNQEEEEVDQENESKDDEIESDEDNGMDDTTDKFDDDVDARLKEPTQTDKEVVQGEGADVEMSEAQQGNENLVTTQEQVVNDAHVTITTVTN